MFKSLQLDFTSFNLEISSRQIKVYTFGNGPRKVLLIPPFATSGAFYAWLLRGHNLSGFSFITFDMPGWTGKSEKYKPGENFKMQDYVDIVQEVKNNMQINECSILGYSFGAALAIRYMAENLNHIHKAVIVSPVIDGRGIKYSKLKAACLFVNKLHAGWVMKTVMQYLFRSYISFAKKQNIFEEGIFNEASDLLDGMQSKILSQSAAELFTIDWREYLNRCNGIKTLVVYSKDENKIFQKQAEIVKSYTAHHGVAYFKGGHESFMFRPEKKLMTEILEFLK